MVVVGDDGAGFEPLLVPNERLGLRLSIIERVANAGGIAEVVVAAGRRHHGDDQLAG